MIGKTGGIALALILLLMGSVAQAQDKPNILIIWGDDIGPYNISAYNMGQMGYRTPNIDRIAREGMIFTDSYGDQSCTAGRAGFITGQHPMRTGLTTCDCPPMNTGADRPMRPATGSPKMEAHLSPCRLKL